MNANFFDIGGSSLLLLNVINELHKQGVEKTIKQFYEHTTLRAICADTIANNITDSQSVMVKLNRSVSGTPLYLVHPFRGRVDCYSVLAKHLEDVCPVYGLQAPYVAGENFDFSDLTQLASYYTSAILANQPDGPYRIAGWSVGGVIAQKVIERLSIMDRQVDYFAGIDCMMINPGVEELSHFESLKKIVGFIINEKYQRNEKNEIIESVCPEDIRALTLEQQLATSAKQLIEKLYAQHSDRRQLIARLKYGVNLLSAKVSLSSVSISGNAVLFVASENLKKELQIKGWKKAISSTSNVIEVDGKHWNILEGESFIQIKNKILADLSPSY